MAPLGWLGCKSATQKTLYITKTRLFKCILKILKRKKENFQIKNSDIFHIPAQNIDCVYSLEPPRWGGSNEYHKLCFLAEIRKIVYTPVNPSFTIQNWGLRGSKLYRHVFVMCSKNGKSGVSNYEDHMISSCIFTGERPLLANTHRRKNLHPTTSGRL